MDWRKELPFLFCELGLCSKDNGAKKRTHSNSPSLSPSLPPSLSPSLPSPSLSFVLYFIFPYNWYEYHDIAPACTFYCIPCDRSFSQGIQRCDNPQRPANAGRDQYDGRVDGRVAHGLRAMRAEVRVLTPGVPKMWGQPT